MLCQMEQETSGDNDINHENTRCETFTIVSKYPFKNKNRDTRALTIDLDLL